MTTKLRIATWGAIIVAMVVLASGDNALIAGVITTSPLANNESQVLNLGTAVISAANFGAGTTASVNINGINHPVASGGYNGAGSDLIPGLTINSTFDGDYRTAQASGAGYTGDMLNLMSGIAGNGSPGPISLGISGLTVGKDYLFQGYWEANNFNQTASVTFEGTDTLNGIVGVGGLGTMITYKFTATDAILNVGLTKTGGTDNIWWQGYSLQEVAVPEPGAIAIWSLLGLVLAGVACHRARRRN